MNYIKLIKIKKFQKKARKAVNNRDNLELIMNQMYYNKTKTKNKKLKKNENIIE